MRIFLPITWLQQLFLQSWAGVWPVVREVDHGPQLYGLPGRDVRRRRGVLAAGVEAGPGRPGGVRVELLVQDHLVPRHGREVVPPVLATVTGRQGVGGKGHVAPTGLIGRK